MHDGGQSLLDIFPTELLRLIVRAAAESEPALVRSDGTSTVWQRAPTEHALVALSQTCTTLRRIAAPHLWGNIAMQTFEGDFCSLSDEAIEYVHKLLIMLQDPLAQDVLRSINIDFHNGEWWGYLHSPDSFEEMLEALGNKSFPTYADWLALTDRLGEALSKTKLTALRLFSKDMALSEACVKRLGQGCRHLRHVEFSFGSGGMPTSIFSLDGTRIRGPDPLHYLSQVNSASVGIGSDDCESNVRFLDGQGWHPTDENEVPFLVKWLRGELPGSSAPQTGDNRLVNLRTTASFLYRQKCLIPAWARFNRLQDALAVRMAEGAGFQEQSFPDGDSVDELLQPGGDWYDEEIAYVLAGCALRSALDALKEGDHDRVTAQDVVKMVHSDPVFEIWRATWFPLANSREDERIGMPEAVALAEEILLYWRKSAESRRLDPGPPTRWYTGWALGRIHA